LDTFHHHRRLLLVFSQKTSSLGPHTTNIRISPEYTRKSSGKSKKPNDIDDRAADER
jgi:hypothetical protein